jgi:nicotinamide phosphoribosyltransferase
MARFQINPLLNADSYKHSHFEQYPEGSESLSSYVEGRKDNSGFGIKELTFFGLQGWIKDHLLDGITADHAAHAARVLGIHGMPFAERAIKKIVTDYEGHAPMTIRAVQEGKRVPIGNVLADVEMVKDQDLFWIGSFYETQILRAAWFGTTVATIDRHCKDIIYKYLVDTCDTPIDEIPFKLHDFGARGASSAETSAIAGAAHLVNFMGTDTLLGMEYANQFYGAPYETLGFSIPAAEHSTITSWGRTNEAKAYRNMVKKFGGKFPAYAVVSDSYDIMNAVKNHWGTDLKDFVMAQPGTLVVRPDSGDPVEVVTTVVGILADKFGYTTNKKGYKVLNKVRVIQGDGVNPKSIEAILSALKVMQFSAENVAFGMGGALHQKVDRDTFSFAMKASAIEVNGVWYDVYKDPVSGGKTSKQGRLALVEEQGVYSTIRRERLMGRRDHLETVYNGRTLVRDMQFDQVRGNAAHVSVNEELFAQPA